MARLETQPGRGESETMQGMAASCPQCQADIAHDDNFCQECGASLSARLAEERQHRERKALLTCLNCGAQHESSSAFCDSCGTSMSAMGVYTTTAPAVKAERSATTAGPPEVGQSSRRRASHLASPLFDRAGQGRSYAASAAYEPADTSSARPLVDLSIAVLVLSFFGMLVWWLVDLEKSRSPFSRKEALVQAQGAIGSDRLDEAIHILERISLSREGKLRSDEEAVLNEALYMRSRLLADKGDYRLALSDLLRVTPQFPQYNDARARVREYVARAQAQMQAPPQAAPGKAVAPRASGGAAAGVAPLQPENARVVAPPAPPKAVASGDGASQKPDSGDSYAQSDFMEDGAALSSMQRADGGQTASSSPRTRWNYSDDDVARYNKLLADYFSPSRMSTRRAIEEGAGVSAENREPPTLNEWLQSGKPDF